MPDSAHPLTYDVAQVARLLGVHPHTVRAAIRRGDIPAIRIGPRRVLVPAAWLDERLGRSGEEGRL